MKDADDFSIDLYFIGNKYIIFFIYTKSPMDVVFSPEAETAPLIYVLFIGGAADKEPFLWGNINLPLVKRWPHFQTYHIARRFHFRLHNYLKSQWHLSSPLLKRYYRCDYLSYSEIFYPEVRRYRPYAVPACLHSPAFNRLRQNIGKYTQVFIVGHSLGAWNGAHLTHLLAAHGIRCRFLVTLDPVGYGNHDVRVVSHLMRQAQIYSYEPIPITENWINIRGFHIRLSQKQYSKAWENWVSWAGGQWLITNSQPESHLLANEATTLGHHNGEKMFNYPTSLGYSADKALQKEISAILQQFSVIPARDLAT